MKRQTSLKWNLIVGMLSVWIVVIAIISFLFNTILSSSDKEYMDMLKRDLTARSAVIAGDISFEAAAADSEGVVGKLRKYLDDNADTLEIGVLDPKRQLIHSAKDGTKIRAILSAVSSMDTKDVVFINNTAAAFAPITPDDGSVIGHVILVRSIQKYIDRKSSVFFLILFGAIFGVSIVIASAYFIGRRLAGPIGVLVEASERIADGDLEHIQIKSEGSRELHRLGSSIKRMADAMQSQVLAIKNLIVRISDISKETEGTMTNLASSAAQQAAAVNETAATVEEMEKAGQSSAVNAKHIVAAAEKTAEASKRGRHTVEKTYEIIMQIKDDSHDIAEKSKNLLNSVEEVGNIIQSVNSIAEQSKILAVNASIEAAKAGEFGAGFAVVAQEVKDLAQQSKDATLQITATLTSIRTAIETMVGTAQRGKERTADGVNSISNAGAVMNDLSEAIRENSDFAKLIATNIQQQTIGLTQIAAAIEEINTTAIENQSISRNIVQGTKQMNETLGLLSDMVGRWRTPTSS
jgi:methyl-accepting chemotaxis protein